MKAGNVFTQLPTWAKGVIVVGTLGTLTYLGFRFGNNIKAYFQSLGEKKEGKEQIKDVKDELKELEKQGIKPTLTDAQLSAIVSALVQSFAGYGSGTTAVYQQFAKIKTDADMYKLIQIFGVKTISSGNWNPEPDTTGSLMDIINNELDTYEKATINKHFQNYNMKFKF